MRLATLIVIAIAWLTSACTHVSAYDRARLAHPTMTGDFGGVASEHVRAVQEGASGGGSVAESGCGCN